MLSVFSKLLKFNSICQKRIITFKGTRYDHFRDVIIIKHTCIYIYVHLTQKLNECNVAKYYVLEGRLKIQESHVCVMIHKTTVRLI